MGRWREQELGFRGVYRPLDDLFNPLLMEGTFRSLMGWKLQGGVLRLVEGEEEALDAQWYREAQPIQWLWHYLGAYNSYYYVTNKELRKITSRVRNTLTNHGVSYNGGADFEYSEDDYMSRAYADLSAGFPGLSGYPDLRIWTDFTPESLPTGNYYHFARIWEAAKLAWAFYMTDANQWRFAIGYNGGADGDYVFLTTYELSPGTRYVVCFSYDDSEKAILLRLYNHATKELVASASKSTTQNMDPGSGANLGIGLDYDGIIHGLAIGNTPMSADEMDALKDGAEFGPEWQAVYRFEENELEVDSSTDAQITDAFLSSTPSSRLSSILFRGKILIASPTEGLRWLDPSSDAWRAAGVAAPSSVPSSEAGDAGDLTGRYRYTATYVNDQGHESNPKTTDGLADYTEVTVTEKKVNLTSIPTGPTGTTKRRIYRTASQGEEFLYLTEIGDNSTTTHEDNAADGTLGSPLAYDNTTPPSNIRQIFASGQRVYLVDGEDGKTLWTSKIDPFTAAPNWEAFPTSLNIKLPFDLVSNPFQAGFELNSFIYAASKKRIYRIYGSSDTGVVVKKALDEGLFSRFSWALLKTKVAYLNESKQLKLWDGENEPVDIGGNVQSILSEMDEASGLDEPSLIYDEKEDAIQVYFRDGSDYKSIRVSLREEHAMDAPGGLQIPLYVPSTGIILGTYPNTTIIYGESGYKYRGSRRTTQVAEWHPLTPNPGKDTYFGRLKIEARATPIISYVPPMLKVEIALDDSPLFSEKIIDLSRDSLVGSEGSSPVKKVMYAPIYERAESIKVKISSVDNDASLTNGAQIYRVSVEVEDEQSRYKRGNWLIDKEN